MKKQLTIILILALALPVLGQIDSAKLKHTEPNFFLRGDIEYGYVLGSADLP